MAPNFRQNTQTRRGNRSGYVEHDDFEGLPVRQWRQEWVKVTPPQPSDTTQKNDIWAIELPHGMPKDSHLLPTHTQELLRAARSGRLYKRPLPTEEEEVDPDAALAEKPEKKEEDPSTKGYQVKVWKQVPRNAEGPTISHLAKRRKGIVTLSSNLPAGTSSGPTVMKATVRRIDAAGNPYTQEITLNEGQQVDGEIISTTVVPAPNAAANGDASVAATPVRRRPPPPKRKPKGPGRGRKKKLPLPATTRLEAPNAAADTTSDGTKPSGAETNGIKPGDQSESKNQDSEMADDDDGDDGEDDGEDGEDGDEGDEEDSEMPDGESAAGGFRAESETKTEQAIEISPAVAHAEPTTAPAPMGTSVGAGLPPPTGLGLPPVPPPLQQVPSHFEGSPLKNVVAATSPTILSPKLPSTNDEPSGPIAATEVEQPRMPSEPTPILGNPVEALPPPAVPVETRADMDVNMTDIPHQEHADSVEQPMLDQEIQRPNVANVVNVAADVEEIGRPPTPAINSSITEDVSTSNISLPSTTIPGIPSAKPPILTEAAGPETVASVAQDIEPQTSGIPPDTFDTAPAPEPIDTKVEPATIEAAEENEPESPDLFSGLEAALNQQGGPEEATPPPPEAKETVPAAE
ncbi:hypothetical protein GGS26DRAFT_589593 [Hypomontagnella submonticulosa]|nr:hypothetical protein GGS26DRAFT_589593 [Hypomontagnella submonticulosa]